MFCTTDQKCLRQACEAVDGPLGNQPIYRDNIYMNEQTTYTDTYVLIHVYPIGTKCGNYMALAIVSSWGD